MEELLTGGKQTHPYHGPYEVKLEKLLDSYPQEQREEICKGLITILKAQDNNK